MAQIIHIFGLIIATNIVTNKRPPKIIYLTALSAFWNEYGTRIWAQSPVKYMRVDATANLKLYRLVQQTWLISLDRVTNVLLKRLKIEHSILPSLVENIFS